MEQVKVYYKEEKDSGGIICREFSMLPEIMAEKILHYSIDNTIEEDMEIVAKNLVLDTIDLKLTKVI